MNSSADLLRELRIDRKAAPEPSRRWPWVVAGVILLLALLGAGAYVLLGGKRGVSVQVAPAVAMGNDSASASVLDATGYVVARRMATVSSKITGKVREVLIEEGQRVEEGQIMATLDPIDQEFQRTLSQSQLAAARSQAAAIEAQLHEADINASRLGRLVGQQLVSQGDVDRAVAARDNLRAQLATSRRNATVSSDQLRIAEQGVDNTIVRAPFAGVVTAKAAQPGEIVSPLSAGGGFTRTGIGTIVDMDSLEVEVDVGEAFIGRVQPKMPVEATLNAYPDWKIPAEVIAIIPAADRGKATVKVRIAIMVKDPRIVPDMGVKVSFLEKAKPAEVAKPQGVRVPTAALVQRDGKDVAFVVGEKDLVEQRAVVLGRPVGAERQVLQGVGPGESLVLDPPDTLKDGTHVRIAGPDADGSSE